MELMVMDAAKPPYGVRVTVVVMVTISFWFPTDLTGFLKDKACPYGITELHADKMLHPKVRVLHALKSGESLAVLLYKFLFLCHIGSLGARGPTTLYPFL